MDEIAIKMMRLAAQGFHCSQIIMILGLELKGETNPSLVRVMTGLAGGCGTGQGTCGALTGGCCLLGLSAGKGSSDEIASEYLPDMLKGLVDWFYGEYAEKTGGIACAAIRNKQVTDLASPTCPEITRAVFDKCIEILTRFNIDWQGSQV